MRTILFVLSAVSYYREVAPVVARFGTSDWKVHVVFGSGGEVTERALEECRSWGCQADLAPANVGYGASGSREDQSSREEAAGQGRHRGRTPSRLREALKTNVWLRKFLHPLGRLRHMPGHYLRMRRIRRYTAELIDVVSPDVVVQGAYHSCGQIDNGIAIACRAANIPTFCVPNSPYLGTRALEVGRLNHLISGMSGPQIRADYHFINALLAVLFRSWTAVLANGVRAFYWDPLIMLTAWINGLSMQRTWLKPSLKFDRVFVFSDYSKNLLEGDGYPVEGVIVSGQPLLDDVWRNLGDKVYGEALFRTLDLPVHSPFILLNVEPAVEHDYCSWERHWQLFEEIMQAVTSFDIPVVLSLHPLCDYNNYSFVEEKFGVRISTCYKIHELYPYCTINVSFPCSTNLLAAEFGKSLVIYDHFHLTTRDSDSAALNRLENAEVGEDAGAIKAILADMLRAPLPTSLPASKRTYASEIIFGEAAKITSSRVESVRQDDDRTLSVSK